MKKDLVCRALAIGLASAVLMSTVSFAATRKDAKLSTKDFGTVLSVRAPHDPPPPPRHDPPPPPPPKKHRHHRHDDPPPPPPPHRP